VLPLLAAIFFALMPFEQGAALAGQEVQSVMGAKFLPWGVVSLFLSLVFFLPTIRGEAEEGLKEKAIYLLGIVGVILAGTGLIWGSISPSFLLPTGLWLALLAIGYLSAFIALHGVDTDIGLRVGKGLGVIGALVMLTALAQSLILRFGWFGVERNIAY